MILELEVYKIPAADEKGYPAYKQLHLTLLQSHKEIVPILQNFTSDKYVPFLAKNMSPFIENLDMVSYSKYNNIPLIFTIQPLN